MARNTNWVGVSVLVLGFLWSGAADAGSAEDAWYKLVGKKFSSRPEFAFVENDAALPNLLIYGDSVSIHYTQRVRAKMAGKANVYRLFRNGGDSSTFIAKMSKMHSAMCAEPLDKPWSFEWDVIQFNVGLHDLKYLKNKLHDKVNGTQVSTIETYKANLENIIVYLEKLAPDATLVFATTTPVAPKELGRKVGDSTRFNQAAREVLARHPKIIINDLHALTKPHHAQWGIAPDNVHYNEMGSNAQGDEVARVMSVALASHRLNER